jgi:hypothetical protein
MQGSPRNTVNRYLTRRFGPKSNAARIGRTIRAAYGTVTGPPAPERGRQGDHALVKSGADDGNRTRVFSLGS